MLRGPLPEFRLYFFASADSRKNNLQSLVQFFARIFPQVFHLNSGLLLRWQISIIQGKYAIEFP